MPDDRPLDPDTLYMRRALELAERGWGRVAPNPMVGAVIVRDGVVVGEGWHAEFGGPHAEVVAIRDAEGRTRGATMYVTLEPCAHQGKTGPCTEAIIAAGITRVVYAVPDPNPVARGGGDVLARAGIEVVSPIEEAAARALNGAFLRTADPSAPPRPWVELKLALSLDGRLADLTGRSGWITGEEARAEVHRLRAGHDAIAVGIGTALADDPQLTVRGAISPRRTPVRVVFDRNLRLSPTSRLVRTIDQAPLWVVASTDAPAEARRALEEAGARIVEAENVEQALEALLQEGVHSIFCEGGAQLASSLLGGDLVDRLTLFHAPFFLGADGSDPFRTIVSRPLDETHRWRRVRHAAFGPDTMISLDR